MMVAPPQSSFGSLAFLNLLKTKDLIIWDFDGSLCDTEPLHYAAYVLAFEAYGHLVREDEYYLRFTQGSDAIAQECEIYGLGLDDEAKRDVRRRKVAHYSQIIASGKARLFPEVPEIVSETQRLGMRWVVASNSPTRENRAILGQLGEPFASLDCVIGPDSRTDLQLRKKPAPDVFLEALAVTSTDASRALVIEDTDKGLLAAAGAGIDAVCLDTRYNTNIAMIAPYRARGSHAELLAAFRTLRRG
jgi:HAD superfamily hydrolase (TIGR01509 family)